jgi:large subunit ribosomal protein L17
MRHKVDGRKFDRNTGSRKALFRNLITQFFQHDRIVTTEAKAKEVRRLAEKLITKAKREDLHARRQVIKVVRDKGAVKRLFDIILAKVSNRNNGGYTRIIKIGNRKGDDAPMALLEILEPGSGQAKTRKGAKKKVSGKAKSKAKKAKTKEKAKEKAAAPKKAPKEKETTTEEVKQDSAAEEKLSEGSATETSQETIVEPTKENEKQTPIEEDEKGDDPQSSIEEETDSEATPEITEEKKEES